MIMFHNNAGWMRKDAKKKKSKQPQNRYQAFQTHQITQI